MPCPQPPVVSRLAVKLPDSMSAVLASNGGGSDRGTPAAGERGAPGTPLGGKRPKTGDNKELARQKKAAARLMQGGWITGCMAAAALFELCCTQQC